MSFDGVAERRAINSRLGVLCGGRVYEGLQDEVDLERYADGKIKPYLTIVYATPFASQKERGLGVGESGQPHILRMTVTAFGGDASDVGDTVGEVIKLLLDFEPNGANATPLESKGGFSFGRRDAQSKPTRFAQSAFFTTTINMNTGT